MSSSHSRNMRRLQRNRARKPLSSVERVGTFQGDQDISSSPIGEELIQFQKDVEALGKPLRLAFLENPDSAHEVWIDGLRFRFHSVSANGRDVLAIYSNDATKPIAFLASTQHRLADGTFLSGRIWNVGQAPLPFMNDPTPDEVRVIQAIWERFPDVGGFVDDHADAVHKMVIVGTDGKPSHDPDGVMGPEALPS